MNCWILGITIANFIIDIRRHLPQLFLPLDIIIIVNFN